jgi:beta-lactam-binding protein with PASTA domain
MAGIFISYRRDDAQGEARHLFDNLKQHFGADRVFMDVIAIRPGEDYRKVIDSAVASCDVLIALIGRDWLRSATAAGQPRLTDARDFVRLETATALKRDVRVIPVLVQGAAMPTEDALPDDLKPLAYRNAIEVSHSRWDYDVRMLTEALERVLPPAPAVAGPAPTTSAPPVARRRIATMGAAGAVAALLLGSGAYWLWPRSTTDGLATAPSQAPSKPEPPPPAPSKPEPPPPASSQAEPTPPAPSRPGPGRTDARPAEPSRVKPPEAPGPSPARPSISVPVPTLRGLREADARAAIERAGLVVGTRATVKRSDVDPGTVVNQTPAPGEPVEKGGSVAIDVAVADLRMVPDLIGKSTREASQALQQEGLKGVFRREATDDVKPHAVLRQQPAAGSEVKPGTAVDVTVAVPATVEVPNLTGMTRSDALAGLERASLKSRVSERPAARERPDTVIGQDPAAGTRAKPGSVVEVQVAVADLRIVVDVVGKSMREAGDLLQKAELRPTWVREATDQVAAGVVLRQDPTAGTRVSPGSAVTVAIAVPASVEVPRLVGLSRSEAADRLNRAGLESRWVTAASRQPPGTILTQNPDPGARVKRGAAVLLTVAVSPDPSSAGRCIEGYVWREAFSGDRVCVTPETRAQAASDNQQATRRIEPDPSKRAYGPDTCRQGFVWREASPTDHVCVTPETRARTADDNRKAASRAVR